jgi:hypothetical protein
LPSRTLFETSTRDVTSHRPRKKCRESRLTSVDDCQMIEGGGRRTPHARRRR